MGTVEENVYRAIEIITEKQLSQLKYDRTIKAEVISLENADTGEYRVKYAGATNVIAYSEDLTQTYKAGEAVYVKCIEQDLSEQKFITGRVTRDSLSATQLTQLQNSIIERSPSLDAFYSYNPENEVGVVAGAPVGGVYSQATIYSYPEHTIDTHVLFQQYAKKYTHIRISAKFQTQLRSIHTKGNYGIQVTFFCTGEGGTVDYVTYTLDLTSFNAAPYRLNHWSEQDVVFEVPANYLIGLYSIKLFEEKFVYDQVPGEIKGTTQENQEQPNIFVKDVSVQYVDVLDMSDVSYHPQILAPYGANFPITRNSGVMVLQAHLYHEGQDLANNSKTTFKWFERNLTVLSGSENYDGNAGVGWIATGDTTQSINIASSKVPHSQQYKVVITHGDVVTSAEIEVTNSSSTYNFDITQAFEGSNTVLRLTSGYRGDWYFQSLDGSYDMVSGGSRVNSVVVTDYLAASSITFYCAVYYGSTYLGVLSYAFSNSQSSEDIVVSYEGDDTFRYDANGDTTYEDSEKSRTLSVTIAPSPHISLLNPTLTWLMLDGTRIPTSYNARIAPPQSMLHDLWVDSSNNLHYTISQKYRQSYTNNTLSLQISTLDGKLYTFNKEILFLKDGDQGTNGTSYVCAIRPCTSSGVKLTGFNPMRYYNNALQNRLYLHCYVYKDGELVTSGVTYKWTPENLTLNRTDSNQVYITGCNAPNLSNSKQMEYYVRVQVTINNELSVYALYPVNMVVGTSINPSYVDIDAIPSYIKYSASGVKPSFYSNDIAFYYNSANYTSNIQSLSPSLLAINGTRLVPADSFMTKDLSDANTIGVVRCYLNASNYIIHPIVMYLDTYGNEAINGWDGTKLELDPNGKYIFAPQIGAGSKDSANRFTGVVMGQDSSETLVGLYGYQSGVASFGLKANGTAFFGQANSGGRIDISGTTATISGGGGGNSANGMTITLANVSSTGDAIKIGNGVFSVNYNGLMYAQQGKIGGKKNDTNGWTLETNRLYSGSGSSRVELNSDSTNDYAIWAGSATNSSAPFSVKKDGTIYSKQGTIGGWTIRRNALMSTNGSVGMSVSAATNTAQGDYASNYAFWVGSSSGTGSTAESSLDSANGSTYFYVTRTGKLYCKSAEVNGKVTATSGEIGGWKISSTGLSSNNNNIQLNSTSGTAKFGSFNILSSGAFYVGSGYNDATFKVSSTGSATISGTVTATSGKIGDWYISGSGLYNTSGGTGATTYITPTSVKFGDFFSVSSNAASFSGNITADGGKIGGWNINSSSLYNGNTYLNSNGTISGANISGGTLSISDNFYVNSKGVYLNGTISTSNITATGGTIGGWTLGQLQNGTRYLYAGNTYLYSSGTIATDTFTINDYGQVGTVQSWNGNYKILGMSSNSSNIAIETRKKNEWDTVEKSIFIRAELGSVGIQSGTALLWIDKNGILHGQGITSVAGLPITAKFA